MVKIKKWQWLFSWFLLWRLGFFLIALMAIKWLPLKLGYLGGESNRDFFKSPFFWGLANFDGVHYLAIAKQGYVHFREAFFPFYPFLVRIIAKILKDENYLISSLLVSHIAFLGALMLFYQLIKLDFREKIAKRAIFYLLIFPAAFYFGSVYTESLFLLLILASFYSARKKRWLLAGLLGGMASATRFVGIFLFPALLIEWWQVKRINGRQIKNLLPLFLIGVGLLVYMLYLRKTTGDPLYFIHIQSIFGPQRTGERIILPYQVCWRYLKMIWTTRLDVLYFSIWLELTATALFFVLAIFSYLRLKKSYFIFMILALLAPTLTGSFSSMPRYVLVLFPGFIALSLLAERYRWLKIAYPLLAIILGAAAASLFIRGYWVA